MGFYLDIGNEVKYISDSYLRYELLNNNKLNSDLSRYLDTKEEALLKKLNIETPLIGIDELIEKFTDALSEENLDIMSVVLTFNRPHLLIILYLFYLSRISISDIMEIISASSTKTRSEILLSYLNDPSDESIDLLAPFFALFQKLGNYKNDFELASTGKNKKNELNNLKSKTINEKIYYVNFGNYFYENFSRNDSKSLLNVCDYWSNSTKLPLTDNVIDNLMQRSGKSSMPSFITVASTLHDSNLVNPNTPLNRISPLFNRESEYVRTTLFKSDYKLFSEVINTAYKFRKWWKIKKDTTFYTEFTKEKIALSAGNIDDCIISNLVGDLVRDKFTYRDNKRAYNENTLFGKIENVIKYSFATYFNHCLRDINKCNVNNTNDSNSIFNIFSLFDQIIMNPSGSERYRYYTLHPSKNVRRTTIDSEYFGSPFHVSGSAIGESSEETKTLTYDEKTVEYTPNVGYIDILKDITNFDQTKINIANALSSLTNVKYSIEGGELKKTKLSNNLDNTFFIKNTFNTLYDRENLVVTVLYFFLSSIYNYKFKKDNKVFETVKKEPEFFNLSELLSYDYLIGDDNRFLNFGTTNFSNIIKSFLLQNNITTRANLLSLQSDPYEAIRNLKQEIDNIKFVPKGNSDRFILSFALEMLKRYLDYLLDDTITDISYVLEVDEFYMRVYRALFVYRHSILSIKSVTEYLNSNELYNIFLNDPFRDREAISRIYDFYKTYSASTIVSENMKAANLSLSKIGYLYVGDFDLNTLIKGAR